MMFPWTRFLLHSLRGKVSGLDELRIGNSKRDLDE